jgi:hypothetical protein
MTSEINRDKLLEILVDVKRQRILFGNNEDATDLETVDNLSTADLVLLRDEVELLVKDSRTLKSYIDDRVRGLLKGKVFKFGNRVFRGRNSSKLVPYDRDKVIEYLGDDWQAAIRPEFRTTAIKAIAEKRGQNPKVVLESLFERVETENLDVNPLNKSPKFIQELLGDEEIKEIKLGD